MYLAKKIPQQKRVENTGLKVLFGNREQKNQITLQNVSFFSFAFVCSMHTKNDSHGGFPFWRLKMYFHCVAVVAVVVVVVVVAVWVKSQI